MTRRYLADFAVGQTFQDVCAEFDPQPFHLDEQAALDTTFAASPSASRRRR